MACALLGQSSLVHRAMPAREDAPMLAPMLDAKGTKILAKSLFKELRASGYNANQILGLSTELIDLVTRDLRAQGDARPAGESSSEAVAP
jgi:hypothetical protein